MFQIETSNLSTRDRLIITAAGLLMRQSFSSVSVDDICRAADANKGTFYHHFPSKIDLALAAYDFMWESFRPRLEAFFVPDVPPLERLARYADGAYQCHKEIFEREGKIYGCPLATAGQEMGAQDDRIRQTIKKHFDHHCAYFETVVGDLGAGAGLRETLGREMFSYAMGVLYQAKVANDPEVIRRDLYAGLKRLLGEDGHIYVDSRSVEYA